MPWYFYLALKQLFPTGRRFPFFTAISVMGVALGVMVLVIVTSVMGGFGYELRRMIVQTEGEVQVKSSQGLIENAGELRGRSARFRRAASPMLPGRWCARERTSCHADFRGVDLTPSIRWRISTIRRWDPG
jgi:lipoprotein-releasing system permease protein